MHLVIAAVLLFAISLLLGIILLSQRKTLQKKQKKEYTLWGSVSIGLACLSLLYIILGYHQHKKLS